MITRIIFDIGGVLFERMWANLLSQLGKVGAVSLEELKSYGRSPLNDAMLGKLNESDVYKQVLEHFGIAIPVRTVQQWSEELLKPVPGIWPIVYELANEYKLSILSDIGLEWEAICEKKFRLSKYFKPRVYSYQCGVRKPDVAFYHHLLNQIEKPLSQCVFIDDRKRNIEPAIALGMNGIVFYNAEQLKKELSGLGVVLN